MKYDLSYDLSYPLSYISIYSYSYTSKNTFSYTLTDLSVRESSAGGSHSVQRPWIEDQQHFGLTTSTRVR